ncbi:hypothetical protein [Cupriavidus basilensis]|uniref:hypothetical protein n=1 Tax=Cupriavidus basilensis TaxID=68895 RepID=UPI0039F733C1
MRAGLIETRAAAPYSARFVTNPCFAAHRLTSCFWIASAQQLLAGGTAVWRERQDLLFGKLHICYAGSLEKCLTRRISTAFLPLGVRMTQIRMVARFRSSRQNRATIAPPTEPTAQPPMPADHEILKSIRASPAGLTLAELLAAHPLVARRTAQRWLSQWVDAGIIA